MAQILRRAGDEIVGVALHPSGRRKHGPEILRAAAVRRGCVFQAARLDGPATLERIRKLGAAVGLSASFGYILRRPLLELFPKGILNLHPAFLPWNRGAYPNVWSIVERKPAGVTLHLLDEGVDTGPIVAQTRVNVRPTDTGESLYRRLEDESLRLFKQAWPKFKRGALRPRRQDNKTGSLHRTKDVATIDRIDLDRAYPARELIDILRARTFPPHSGAFFETSEGKRIGIQVTLTELDATPTRTARSKRI